MTGFAQEGGESGDIRWRWEIRSVNGRGLDLRLRLPTGLERLDTPLRAAASGVLARGSITANLTVERDEASGLTINRAALDRAIDAALSVRDRIPDATINADGLLALRGVAETAESGPLDDSHDAALIGGFERAVASLVQARRSEGARIAAVLNGIVDRVEQLTGEAETNPARSLEAIAGKIRQQLDQLIDAAPSLEPQRLHQEAAILATKADVREELDRLKAHIAAARELLEEGGQVGRKLDFLTQEFNREANTLCSKSNDASLTATGLALKAAIDQLREQVQNIE
ncbi:MAG: YicC family protein [Rhodobiaceae bacterium]|nr:YicC family protein [Rhodobiaceae bacterium]MCC0056507.1 YicC family protein [Rhodobiaceae bacterium]